MCLVCRRCFDVGEGFCPLKDELLSIREKLNKADGVILASPVYVEGAYFKSEEICTL